MSKESLIEYCKYSNSEFSEYKWNNAKKYAAYMYRKNPIQFYTNCDAYLYDLEQYNLAEERIAIRNGLLTLCKSQELKSALDVGCGLGYDAMLLSDNGINVTAYDLHGTTNNYFKWLLDKITFSSVNVINTLPTSDKFDLVYSIDVVEHIVDWKVLVDQCIDLTSKVLHMVTFHCGIESKDHPMHVVTENLLNIMPEYIISKGFDQIAQFSFRKKVI